MSGMMFLNTTVIFLCSYIVFSLLFTVVLKKKTVSEQMSTYNILLFQQGLNNEQLSLTILFSSIHLTIFLTALCQQFSSIILSSLLLMVLYYQIRLWKNGHYNRRITIYNVLQVLHIVGTIASVYLLSTLTDTVIQGSIAFIFSLTNVVIWLMLTKKCFKKSNQF